MRWTGFKQFVAKKPKFKHPPEMQEYAQAVLSLMDEGLGPEEIGAGRVAKSFKMKKSTLLNRISHYNPNQEFKMRKRSRLDPGASITVADMTSIPQGQRIPGSTSADRAVSTSLGVAYAQTISRIANRLNWFGDALMGIGSEAFMGYLMSQQLPPDEVQQKLLTFSSPDALVKDFKDYFGNLLQSSAEASALTMLERRLECTKALVAAYQWKFEELMKAHFALTRRTSIAMSMLNPGQMKRLLLAEAIEKLGTIDTLTSMPPPGTEGQPPAKPKEGESKEGAA